MKLANIPVLGAGLGYRSELDAQIMSRRASIDWLEVIAEQYFVNSARRSRRLAELVELFPIVSHGVEMSIGTEGEIDADYVEHIAQLVPTVRAPWFSDHLCYTRSGGVALGALTPLHRSRAAARRIACKAQSIQDRVGVPFILENITYYLDLKGELSESEFLTEVMEHCDCGILLDLANLHINSVNHRYDPEAWLESIPVERVVQVHLAGGHRRADIFLDTHAARVPDEVWSLLSYVVARAPNLKGVLIERDDNYPDDFEELVGELDQARSIMKRAAP